MITTTATPGTYSTRATIAPQLQVWNGTAYDFYYYLSDAYDEEADDEVTGWAKGNGDLADTKIACGTGYWYKAPTAASTFTLPGQVLNAASVTKPVVASKFDLMGNPYPTALNLSKVVTTAAPGTYSTRATAAPQLQIWNGTAYDFYYYLSDAYDEEADDEVTGWAKGNGDLAVSDVADATKGLWLKSPTAGTITFTK